MSNINHSCTLISNNRRIVRRNYCWNVTIMTSGYRSETKSNTPRSSTIEILDLPLPSSSLRADSINYRWHTLGFWDLEARIAEVCSSTIALQLYSCNAFSRIQSCGYPEPLSIDWRILVVLIAHFNLVFAVLQHFQQFGHVPRRESVAGTRGSDRRFDVLVSVENWNCNPTNSF